MRDALVSVIVPVYRNPEWVKTALDSVIRQTWKNLEILVIDDGSPDGCDAVCDQFAALDDRIHVVHRENGGVSAARNDGLLMAKGEFVAFLDSDDYLAIDHISSLVQCALDKNADIVSNRMYFYLNDTCTRKSTPSDAVVKLSREEAVFSMHSESEVFNGYLMNKLFRREILKEVRFDPTIAIHEDMLFIWQAILKSDVIVSCERYTYHYLFHPTSAVNSYSPRYDTAVVAAKRMAIRVAATAIPPL
jgi:glycosyltransferase involved in cell wall biosynthesis